MNPRSVPSEFLYEHRPRDRSATLAAADVLDVRDAALDHFAVVVVDRERPHFFAGHPGTGQKLIGERLVGAEYSDVNVSEGDYNRAGERGCIDQMCAAK